MYRRLVESGRVLGLGEAPADPDRLARELPGQILAVGGLATLARKGSRLVDGLGVDRVLDVVEQLGR